MRISSDRRLLPASVPPTPILFPFWGAPAEDPRMPEAGRYARFLSEANRYLELVPLERADAAILPFDWSHAESTPALREEAFAYSARVRSAGRPLWIFFWADSERPVPIDGAVVFRTSTRRSRRTPGERGMPSWSEDFLERYLDGRPATRKKRERPTVGFCGHAPSFASRRHRWTETLRRGARLAIGRPPAPPHPGDLLRSRALRALARSPLVDLNVRARDRFLGGAERAGTVDYERMREVRREYVRNMVESDYVLCARGGGNFSYRFYETLSCGRIPIVVDSDGLLPFHEEIDWRRHGVWIDEAEVDRIGERVADFHRRISAAEFEALQTACRRLWEDRLSPHGFFRSLAEGGVTRAEAAP